MQFEEFLVYFENCGKNVIDWDGSQTDADSEKKTMIANWHANISGT